MPTFLPMIPSIAIVLSSVLSAECTHHSWMLLLAESFNFDIHTGGQLELHERVDGLRRRLENVEQPLVRAHLELLPRLLVHMRTAQDRVARHLRRQRNRARHFRSGALGRVDDLRRGLIEDAVVIRFEPDADLFVHHFLLPLKNSSAVPHRGTAATFTRGSPRPCRRPPYGHLRASRSEGPSPWRSAQ